MVRDPGIRLGTLSLGRCLACVTPVAVCVAGDAGTNLETGASEA